MLPPSCYVSLADVNQTNTITTTKAKAALLYLGILPDGQSVANTPMHELAREHLNEKLQKSHRTEGLYYAALLLRVSKTHLAELFKFFGFDGVPSEELFDYHFRRYLAWYTALLNPHHSRILEGLSDYTTAHLLPDYYLMKDFLQYLLDVLGYVDDESSIRDLCESAVHQYSRLALDTMYPSLRSFREGGAHDPTFIEQLQEENKRMRALLAERGK